MTRVQPAKRTTSSPSVASHWALLLLTVLVLSPRTLTLRSAIWRGGGSTSLVAFAPLTHSLAAGVQATNANISRHAYGYAPDGQISWFDREADSGQSGSALENGRGDSFYYWPDGSLQSADRDYANTAGWPNALQLTGDARVNPATLSAPGGTNTYTNSYNYGAAGNRTSVAQLSPQLEPRLDLPLRRRGQVSDTLAIALITGECGAEHDEAVGYSRVRKQNLR